MPLCLIKQHDNLSVLCYKTGRSQFRFPIGLLVFLIDLILPASPCLWGNSACNRNENQGSSLGGKGGRCVGLATFPSSCADFLEILGAATSWSPKDLSRPVMGWLYNLLVLACHVASRRNLI